MHRNLAVAAAGIALAVGIIGAPVTAARSPHLTMAQRAAALALMAPNELALRQNQFLSKRYDVIGYTRTVQAFDRITGLPVGQATQLTPNQVSPDAAAAGSGGNAYLTLTVSVAYDRSAPPHRWDIQAYFDWTQDPPSTYGEDSIGLAWANGLALNSDHAYGYAKSGHLNTTFYRSDAVPNAGVGWSWSEWFTGDCTKCNKNPNWGYLLATIKETSLHGNATNIVAKYFHTYQGLNYYLVISPSPGITINPTTSTWGVAAYTSFTN